MNHGTPCPACGGRGFVLVNVDSGYSDAETCDQCRQYDTDSEAREAAYRRLTEAEEILTTVASGNTETETLEHQADVWCRKMKGTL